MEGDRRGDGGDRDGRADPADPADPADRADAVRTAPGVDSYALLGAAVRRHYLGYYKLVFADGALDLRTKELIALGVALVTGAPNCVEGHLRKCVELGVSRAELEDVVATALGVAGASIVDRADIGWARAQAGGAAADGGRGGREEHEESDRDEERGA